jgi:hypothetical protein
MVILFRTSIAAGSIKRLSSSSGFVCAKTPAQHRKEIKNKSPLFISYDLISFKNKEITATKIIPLYYIELPFAPICLFLIAMISKYNNSFL